MEELKVMNDAYSKEAILENISELSKSDLLIGSINFPISHILKKTLSRKDKSLLVKYNNFLVEAIMKQGRLRELLSFDLFSSVGDPNKDHTWIEPVKLCVSRRDVAFRDLNEFVATRNLLRHNENA